MNSRAIKKLVFSGSKKYEPNTFIGGVANTITSASEIASILNIPVSGIKAFSVVDNDIQFHVKNDYEIPGSAFRDNEDITYYRDEGGKLSELKGLAFKGASNLKTFKSHSCAIISGSSNDISGAFWDCVLLEECDVPNLTTMSGYNHFRNTPKLLEMDFSNLVGEPAARTFLGCGITEFDFQSLVSLGSESEMRNATIINTPVLINVAHRGFYNARNVKVLNLPYVTNIPNKGAVFSQMREAEQINAKNLKYLGDPADIGNSGGTLSFITFYNLKTNCYIRVNIALATINNGDADAALQWAKDNRSAIVEFYDDNGDYVSTL